MTQSHAQKRCFRPIFFCLLLLIGAALTGCGPSRYDPSGEAVLDLRNPNLLLRDRVAAAMTAWEQAGTGERNLFRTRQAMKELGWSRATPEELRVTLVRLLMSDTTPDGVADSRRMARLMLPSETSRAIVAVLSEAVGRNGWAEVAPALVRSYAREVPGVTDDQRVERVALRDLFSERSVQENVFAVFLDPAVPAAEREAGAAIGLDQRIRSDAWSVLARLDPSGDERRRLLARPLPEALAEPARGRSRQLVDALNQSMDAVSVLPDTAMELDWLDRLLHAPDLEQRATNRAWWDETASVIATLPASKREALALRHLEPIRWSAAHRPEWLAASREALLGAIEARLRDRGQHIRAAEPGARRRARPERLRDHREALSWADALAILVVDESLRAHGFADRLFEQVELDRRDTTTEYGGVIESVGPAGAESFRILLFRPRERDRVGDDQFVASDDMLRYSDRALAHYHQQVQRTRNSKYAGPSDADVRYAERSGRTCVVFTSINSRTLNVDYYQPGAIVIDLGVLRR